MAIDFSKILQLGDKIYEKKDDRELLCGLDSITDNIMRQYSKQWEKVYLEKSKKITGTLFRFSTMAISEERNLMVRASQWAVNPRKKAHRSDEVMLSGLVASIS